MKEFFVYVDVTFSATIKVTAEDREQAKRLAEEMADNAPSYYCAHGSYCGAGAYDCDEIHPYDDLPTA